MGADAASAELSACGGGRSRAGLSWISRTAAVSDAITTVCRTSAVNDIVSSIRPYCYPVSSSCQAHDCNSLPQMTRSKQAPAHKPEPPPGPRHETALEARTGSGFLGDGRVIGGISFILGLPRRRGKGREGRGRVDKSQQVGMGWWAGRVKRRARLTRSRNSRGLSQRAAGRASDSRGKLQVMRPGQ